MESRIKVTESNRQTAAFGLKYIAEAFSSYDGDDFVRHIKGGMRYLQEFLGDVNPLPSLTEKEADVTRNLHTYLRKGNDEPYSCIIYPMVSESRGLNIWYAFTKSLANDVKKLNYHEALHQAQKAYRDGSDTTDDGIMLAALKMWETDWKYTKEWFKQ
jgi:hypothetical protein